jgi:hypothetical protein
MKSLLSVLLSHSHSFLILGSSFPLFAVFQNGRTRRSGRFGMLIRNGLCMLDWIMRTQKTETVASLQLVLASKLENY